MPDEPTGRFSPAAVVGAGRVGLALAIFLERLGLDVTVGVRSDHGRERVEAASDLPTAAPADAVRGARLVVLAVLDDELPSLITALAADGAFGPDQIVIHTAGVDGPELLTPASAAGATVAACHPVQIFNEDLEAALARKQRLVKVYAALARLIGDRAAAAGRLDPDARRRVEAALQGQDDDGEDSGERRELLRRLGRRARGRDQR